MSLFRSIIGASRRSHSHRIHPSTIPPTRTLQQQAKRFLRPLTAVSIASALSISTYTLGAFYPPDQLSYLFPRPAPPPPADHFSSSSLAYTQSLESTLQSLPLLTTLRNQPDSDNWYETRPYQNFPEDRRVNNLTAGALRGPGKLALPPLVRARRDELEAIVLVHVGRSLCGHDGIIHGGLLATLLDESLARIAINNLPDKVGVTANLSINYRAPTKADQFIVIKTHLVEVKGRKSVVSGQVEDMNGNRLVDASATFVQPRYAKVLNTTAIEQAIGVPPPPVQLTHG